MVAPDAYPYDVGNYHQPIHTTSPDAQRWFNRGWVWLSAYHREEAAFCFGEAAKADPGCAMAYWGMALAHGPDYNFHAAVGFYDFASQPEGWPSINVAFSAITKAAALCAGGDHPPREKALVRAMALRYEWPVTSTTPGLQAGYADAMERAAFDFPDDADLQAVACEAIMILRPWDLYEKPPGSSTPPWHSADKVLRPIGERVSRALERGLAAAPEHTWLCHLRIHMNEMGPIGAIDWRAADAVRAASPWPCGVPFTGHAWAHLQRPSEFVCPAARAPRGAATCSPRPQVRRSDAADCGHLLHMPSHLDIQVGEYRRAMDDNVRAYKADLRVHAHSPSRFTIHTGYLVHNVEFCA